MDEVVVSVFPPLVLVHPAVAVATVRTEGLLRQYSGVAVGLGTSTCFHFQGGPIRAPVPFAKVRVVFQPHLLCEFPSKTLLMHAAVMGGPVVHTRLRCDRCAVSPYRGRTLLQCAY